MHPPDSACKYVEKNRILRCRSFIVNVLHRTCVTMSIRHDSLDLRFHRGHRSIDRLIWCQRQQRRQKSYDITQFQFRRRRYADRSVGFDRADTRNQCWSFDRFVVRRRFLRRCPRRLEYVDDRWRAISRRSINPPLSLLSFMVIL